MDSKIISKCLSAFKTFFVNVTSSFFAKTIEEEITIRSLKAWRTDSKNKIVAARKSFMLEALSKDESQFHDDIFEIDDVDVIIAEYDPNADEIIKITYSESAGEIESILNENDGVIILE